MNPQSQPSMRSTSHRCRVALLLAPLLLHLAAAQRPGFVVPKWAQNRYFWLSSDAPMLSHMLKQPAFNESSILLTDYFASVEADVLSTLQSGRSPPPTQSFSVCNQVNKKFAPSIRQVFGMRGLVEPPYDCISDVVGTHLFTDRVPKYSVNDVFNAAADRNRLLIQAKTHFLNNLVATWQDGPDLMADWSAAAPVGNYPWNWASKRCNFSVFGFIRERDIWYSSLSITNAPVNFPLPDTYRQFITENVHVDPTGRNSHAMSQIMPKYNRSDEPPLTNTTTIFFRLAGEARQAAFFPIYPDENPAVQAAMDQAEPWVQRANEAVAYSNIAILLLPLLLNLVPIALITHVGRRTMLLYMLLSDIVPVIPLAVKGSELVAIGRQRHRSVVTRVYSAINGTRGETGAGEMWTAECMAEPQVLPTGTALLVVALALMFVGIALELWASAWMAKRDLKKKKKSIESAHIADDEDYDCPSYKLSLKPGVQACEPTSMFSTCTLNSR